MQVGCGVYGSSLGWIQAFYSSQLLLDLPDLVLHHLGKRLDTFGRLLLGILDGIAGGIIGIFGLLDGERREDVGLDLEFVKLGRCERGRRKEAGDTAGGKVSATTSLMAGHWARAHRACSLINHASPFSITRSIALT